MSAECPSCGAGLLISDERCPTCGFPANRQEGVNPGGEATLKPEPPCPSCGATILPGEVRCLKCCANIPSRTKPVAPSRTLWTGARPGEGRSSEYGLKYVCPRCAQTIVARDAWIGRRVLCPSCIGASLIAECPRCRTVVIAASDAGTSIVECESCAETFEATALPELQQESDGSIHFRVAGTAFTAFSLVLADCPTCHQAVELVSALTGRQTDCPGCRAPLFFNECPSCRHPYTQHCATPLEQCKCPHCGETINPGAGATDIGWALAVAVGVVAVGWWMITTTSGQTTCGCLVIGLVLFLLIFYQVGVPWWRKV